MRGYNRVVIAGNLARDPALNYTSAKRAFLRFTVAVGNRFKNSSGEVQEVTDYISVVAWGPIGESVVRFLKKGTPVLVEGRLKTGSYEKDGIKRYTTDVNADSIILLGSNPNSNGEFRQSNSNNTNITTPPYVSPMPGNDFESFNDGGFSNLPDFNNIALDDKSTGLGNDTDIPF